MMMVVAASDGAVVAKVTGVVGIYRSWCEMFCGCVGWFSLGCRADGWLMVVALRIKNIYK